MSFNDFSGMRALLAPSSVAVIGASADPLRIGGLPIASMLAQKFAGAIWPVNPTRDTVQGLKCYPAVAALPSAPEAAIVAVPAALAVSAVGELARAGTRAAIVFSAGFAEAGPTGLVLQQRMLADATAHGMRILGPNTVGLFNAPMGYYPFFSTAFEHGYPPPGAIGIASQSGAFGSQLFNIARNRGMGTPVCITTGNEADVTIGDAIGWLVDDPQIQVIVAYMEGVRHPARFVAALDAARRARKPLVVMKTGRSALGASAVQSHTAAMAGDDRLFDAVLAEHGAVRAAHTEELLDIAYAATRRIYPAGNTLGAISLSGGVGIQISDAAEACGLPMPQFDAAGQQTLKHILPFASPVNPIDITAQALNDLPVVGQFARIVAERGGYSSIVAYLAGVGGSQRLGPLLCEQFGAVARDHPKRLWVIITTAGREQTTALEKHGLLVFEEPVRAVRALEAMGRFGDAFTRSPPAPLPVVPAQAAPQATPSEAEAKRWLAQAGIDHVPEAFCASAGAAIAAARQTGYPVVLKVVSPQIVHKSEAGGVKLDLTTEADVSEAYASVMASAARLRPDARIDGVLIAKQITGAMECLMSVHRDPSFGMFAAFGLGGIFTEVLDDVAFHRCPFGEDTAEKLIRSIRGAPLLLGARGRAPVDIKALAAMLAKLSVIADQQAHTLQSIELNPVFAFPEGQGALAADAVIELIQDAQ